MVRPKAIIFVSITSALFAGCRLHSSPSTHGVLLNFRSHDLHELPPGRYDAFFACTESSWGNENRFEKVCDATVNFFNDSGKMIRLPADLHVTVNGDTVQGIISSRVRFDFPEQLTWRVEGSEHYPSITHTIASDSSIEFLSPDSIDPTTIYSGFEVRYHAPQDIDSIGLLISYQGQGIYKRDTMNRIKWTGQDYWERARNTGRYFVRPFTMDSLAFRTFEPQKLLVLVRWAKGDTVHVGPFVYGFSTESHSVRDFKLKN